MLMRRELKRLTMVQPQAPTSAHAVRRWTPSPTRPVALERGKHTASHAYLTMISLYDTWVLHRVLLIR